MVEQKAKKKKLRILGQVLKWIFVTLVALLLVAGIYFQAPGKVLTLLAVILAALTILPRPARKWFRAGVGMVVIFLVVWVFLPEESEGWRPYTFDKELAALEAKRAIPDEENAATIYNKLLANYDPNVIDPNFLDADIDDLIRNQPWLRKDYPEAGEWLTEQDRTIATLMRACGKDKCRFPLLANIADLGKRTDHLAPMRRWAQLLIRAGNNDLGEGRPHQALEKYTCALQMAKHLYQQPTMLDLLVGFAIEALATRQLNRFIVTADPAEEHISIIEKALAEIKHNWGTDLPKILDTERLFSKNFWAMFYEVNEIGKLRFRRNFQSLCPAELEITFGYWQKKLIKSSGILWWFYMPSTPQKAGKIIDASYERFYAMAKPNFNWQKGPQQPKRFSLTSAKFNYRAVTDMLLSIMQPAYHRIHDTYLGAIGRQRGSLLVIALGRYKNRTSQWPERLEEVKSLAPAEIFVDPINGDSFVYKLTEENFTFYSKGKNNIDEDGQYNSKWDPNDYSHHVEEDDRLIWPPKSCKTKKETTDAE